MRRPTTPTSTTSNRSGRASPVVSQRTRSPVTGSSSSGAHPSLPIRNFNQVSNHQYNSHRSFPQQQQQTPNNTNSNNNNYNSARLYNQQQTPTAQINHPHYPPMMPVQRSPRVPAGSTPNSARSASCINDLEGAINEVFRDRMNSLAESRKRVEELAELHKRETEDFLGSMEHILATSNVASTAQSEMMEDYESRLAREKSEKGRMLDILQRFKSEGDRVTSDLKRALLDEREKHKEASFKNDQMSSKIRELQTILTRYQQQVKELQQWKQHHQKYPPTQQAQSQQQQQQQQAPSASNDPQQIIQLVELLKEHERVIDELERRNRNLEHDLRYQNSQRNRLEQKMTSGGSQPRQGSNTSSSLDHNNNNMIHTEEPLNIPDSIPDVEPGDELASLDSLVQQYAKSASTMQGEQLHRLTRGLLNQVRSENRNRLRVEEQYVRLVADQDSQIRRLEAKLRDYESIMSSNGINPNSGSSKNLLSSPSPNKQHQQQQPSGLMMSPPTANNNIRRQQPGAVDSKHSNSSSTNLPLGVGNGPRLPTLTGTASNPSTSNQNSGANTPRTSSALNVTNNVVSSAKPPQQPKQQAVIGLEQQQREEEASADRKQRGNNNIVLEEDEDIPPAHPPPVSTTTIEVRHSQHREEEDDDTAFLPEEPHVSNRNGNGSHRQQSVGSTTTTNKAPSITVSELPSLEDQLNDVTNDFNQSLDMWNKAAAGTTSNGGGHSSVGMDAEFQPED